MIVKYFRNAPYREILEIQEREFQKRVNLRKSGQALPEDLLLITEHLPVYTLGKHGKETNMLVPDQYLDQNGIDFVKINRGGDITYHGPGQLTVYPIIDLQRYRLGVKEYVNLLEETVIRTLSSYGIKGERVEGATGVWIDVSTPKERKISAIGIKCSRFVTMHGLSLNVGSDLSGFSRINPCGFIDKGVTSLSIECQREIDIMEVGKKLEEEFIRLLQLRIPSQGNS